MRYFCHEHPDIFTLETAVVDARPGAVVLEQTPFYPGGGGQLVDRGLLRWSGGETRVTAIEEELGRFWHLLAEPVEVSGTVEAVVDSAFRTMMTQLHTGTDGDARFTRRPCLVAAGPPCGGGPRGGGRPAGA